MIDSETLQEVNRVPRIDNGLEQQPFVFSRSGESIWEPHFIDLMAVHSLSENDPIVRWNPHLGTGISFKRSFFWAVPGLIFVDVTPAKQDLTIPGASEKSFLEIFDRRVGDRPQFSGAIPHKIDEHWPSPSGKGFYYTSGGKIYFQEFLYEF